MMNKQIQETPPAREPKTKDPFLEIAVAIEIALRSFASSVQHHAPDNQIAAAIYRHAPTAFQPLIGRPGPPSELTPGYLDPAAGDALRADGISIPPSKPEDAASVQMEAGSEALEGARIAGAIEQRFGAPIDLLMARWRTASGIQAENTASIQAFADAAARRAIGYIDAPLPGVGLIPLQQWAEPPRGNPVFRDFAGCAGRCLFARADDARRMTLGWPPADTPRPTPPDAAVVRGARLAGAIEDANGEALDALLLKGVEDRKIDETMIDDIVGIALAGGGPADPPFDFVVPALSYDVEAGLDPAPLKTDAGMEATA